jgi:two-component system, NtrC family, nitrogen regulation response regulator NtrX
VIMSLQRSVDVDDLPSWETSTEPAPTNFRFQSFKDATDAYQREFIQHKLAEFAGNVSRAAEDMGVDRSHLYRRMRNLGIHQRPDNP